MRPLPRHCFPTALVLAVILTAPAGATVQNYELNLGPYGSGAFAFDDVDIVWGADHAVDGGVLALDKFLNFHFSFDGSLFAVADVTGQGAWFYGDNVALEPDLFVGLDLSGSKDGDSIDFTPGFGLSQDDLGTFQGVGDPGGDTGPIALRPDNLYPSLVPEPNPWPLALPALAFALRARAHRRAGMVGRMPAGRSGTAP